MAKHILIVDDDDALRQTLKIFLETNGYEVTAAQSGRDALNKIQDKKIDLAIVDLFMDEMDGLSFCHEIRQRPEKEDILIVFLTAAEFKGKDRENIRDLKVAAFIQKPYDNTSLLNKIQSLVGE